MASAQESARTGLICAHPSTTREYEGPSPAVCRGTIQPPLSCDFTDQGVTVAVNTSNMKLEQFLVFAQTRRKDFDPKVQEILAATEAALLLVCPIVGMFSNNGNRRAVDAVLRKWTALADRSPNSLVPQAVIREIVAAAEARLVIAEERLARECLAAAEE